jgi:hypothetical protein
MARDREGLTTRDLVLLALKEKIIRHAPEEQGFHHGHREKVFSWIKLAGGLPRYG